jgi:PAP2 superfamily protein/wax ester synthase-like acyl-CoA acyltransferase family protein/uncharacterized protein DUF1298
VTKPSPFGEQTGVARLRIWWELLGGLVLFACYILVDSLDGAGRADTAQRNGRDILALERSLHIPVEEWLNDWLVQHPGLQTAANYEYAFTYILSALALLAWLYIKRPVTYRWARNSFIVLNLIAMACFVFYPTAPPRLLHGESGFYDTVLHGQTWGSWGSPLVESANQVAAMPSLHIAWAFWVSIVLACISGARWLQGLSALHVLLTAFVVMATANHYLLDVAAGALLVWITVVLMGIVADRPGSTKGERLGAEDAFFLYAESAEWPQHVGGIVMLDEPDAVGYQRRMRKAVAANLDTLPRFRQVLHAPGGWRRPRWRDHPDIDWDWHTPLVDLKAQHRDALDEYVAKLQQELLPRDRPLWRYVTVTGFGAGRTAMIVIVHHSVADGIGTIEYAMRIMEPTPPTLGVPTEPLRWWRRAAAITLGLARLATDGGSGARLPSSDSAERGFHSFDVALDMLRGIAHRHEVRLTDVLMSVTAGSLRRAAGDAAPDTLRITTPLMVRAADSGSEGNLTAAVTTTVPTTAMSETQRLLEIGRRARQTERATRALASRFVMTTAAKLLPPPVHAWFARTVYGFRFVQAIVTNMPGPSSSHEMAGSLMLSVCPIIPLARRAPIAVGAISWSGVVSVGITIGPDLVADSAAFAAAARAIIDELDGVADIGPSETAAANRARG